MSEARVLYHLVRADFLERVRRYSFLGTLAFAVWLAYLAATGDIVVRLADWRGQYNSAWLGMMMTLICTSFVSLVGFYVVSNSVRRDEQTRVGRILAATPMSRVSYTVAKAISNFAVLCSMVAVLAVAAVVLQLLRGEDRHLHLWALLGPFLIVALPLMAVIAAVAVFFETTPILRGGFGNVAWVFVWATAFVAGMKLERYDLYGVGVYERALTAVVHSFDPAYKDAFTLSLEVGQPPATRVFVWNGLSFSTAFLVSRVLWVLAALALAALASVWFHRFDPARERARSSSGPRTEAAVEKSEAPALSATHLTPLADSGSGWWFPEMFLGELRLLAARRPWFVYAISAGLVVVSFAAPLDAARRGVLAAAFMWPTLVLSRMGAREDLFSTRALVFAAPNALSRQLLAAWLAGSSLVVVLTSGVGFRLAARGDLRSFSALLVGTVFVPALALALGNLTRTPKAFEAIYTGWWYIGPLNHVPGCDYFGVTTANARPLQYALFTVALISAAWMVRQARMARA
jgi:hypothetical protein